MIRELPEEGLPMTIGDPFQLERVLTNLVSNALKFTSKPGFVILKGSQEDNLIKINVTDSGEGIPPEETPHLFTRYYRTKTVQGKVKGTGLGLYIVRSIVESHGGKWMFKVNWERNYLFFLDSIVPPENNHHDFLCCKTVFGNFLLLSKAFCQYVLSVIPLKSEN